MFFIYIIDQQKMTFGQHGQRKESMVREKTRKIWGILFLKNVYHC